MSDTPRTDAVIFGATFAREAVESDFARQLERELAEALKQRDEWFEVFKKNLKEKGNLSDQLAEAREKVTTAWTENIILDSRNRQLELELAEAREDAANQRRLADMALAHRDMIIEERDTLVDAVDEFLSQIVSPLAPLRQALAAVKGGDDE